MQEQIPIIIDYVATIHEFLPMLCDNKIVTEEFTSRGIFEFLIDFCIQQANDLKLPPDEKIVSINLLFDIWKICPPAVENSEGSSNKILNIFEKISRDKSKVFQIIIYGKFFQLFQWFTETKNSFAPMIYKIITFSLIENFSDIELREMIFYNFLQLFQDFPEIPLKILLEPLIKHLKISEQIVFNVADFTFFSVICKNPRLTFKLGLLLMDVLAKMYMDHLEYYDLIGDIFLNISERFIDIESVQKYLEYFIKFYLKELENVEKNKKNPNSDEQIIAIMRLITGCTRLHSEPVNQNIKFAICSILIENKNKNLNDWLTNTLNIIGDPLEIIEEYKNSLKIDIESEKNPTPDIKSQKVDQQINIRESNLSRLSIDKRTTSPPKKIMRKQIEKKIIKDDKDIIQEKILPSKIIKELTEEENEHVKLYLKNNQAIISDLFKKYSANYKKLSKVDTFAKMAESFNHISDVEYFQIIKDLNNITIPQTAFTELIKEYCVSHNKSKKRFNFFEFQEIFVQLAMLINQKSSEDYSLYPPVISLMTLIKELKSKNIGLDKNTNKILSKEIEILNKELKKNSNYELPPGYKKVLCKTVEISYKIPSILNFPESKSIPITILDDLLFSLYNIHFIEPIPIIIIYYIAKPESIIPITKFKEISVDKSLPNGIKYNIPKPSQENDSEIINEVNLLVKDLIIATESAINKISSPVRVKYINKIQAMRNHSINDKEKEKNEREKKRLLRVQLVKQKVNTLYKSKAQREMEKKKKSEDDELKKQKLIKKLEEKIERDRKIRLEEIEKWKKTRDEEIKNKEFKEKERLIKEREVRIKKRDEFFENEKQRIKKLSQDNLERKITMTKIEVENTIKTKNTRLKKLKTHKFQLEKSRKNQEEEKIKEEALLQEYNNAEVQQIFSLYSKSLELVFLNYCKIKYNPTTGETVENTLLKFDDFYKFALHFKITPVIIPQQDIKKMFISVIKTQGAFSITFESFKLLCFKISKICTKADSEMFPTNTLQEFLQRMELPQDLGSARNLLRRQETLRNSI